MRYYVSSGYDFDITSFVKAIIIINVAVWLSLVVILQGLFLREPYVFDVLGLKAERVFSYFWFWQILTYFFVHSQDIFHIFFNMFTLWMFGTELERFWGSKFFLSYYIFCGLGAAVIYLLCLGIGWSFFQMNPVYLQIPMVGASGAIFGLLFAYGLIFSERMIFVMLIFPIKARYFVFLIGIIEFVSLINSGVGSPISHLAHLSGFASGFLFLKLWKVFQDFDFQNRARKFTRLKIVKSNDDEDEFHH